MALLSSESVQAAAEPTASLNVLYPHQEGAKFDLTYYRSSHIPLVTKVMKATNVILIEGVPMGETPAPFVMIAHIQFASAAALQAGHGQNRLHIGAEGALERRRRHQRVVAVLIFLERLAIDQQSLGIGALHLHRAGHDAFDRVGHIVRLVEHMRGIEARSTAAFGVHQLVKDEE